MVDDFTARIAALKAAANADGMCVFGRQLAALPDKHREGVEELLAMDHTAVSSRAIASLFDNAAAQPKRIQEHRGGRCCCKPRP